MKDKDVCFGFLWSQRSIPEPQSCKKQGECSVFFATPSLTLTSKTEKPLGFSAKIVSGNIQ